MFVIKGFYVDVNQQIIREGKMHTNRKHIFLVPIALSVLLAGHGLGTRPRALEIEDFPVPDSRTSGPHVCSMQAA